MDEVERVHKKVLIFALNKKYCSHLCHKVLNGNERCGDGGKADPTKKVDTIVKDETGPVVVLHRTQTIRGKTNLDLCLWVAGRQFGFGAGRKRYFCQVHKFSFHRGVRRWEIVKIICQQTRILFNKSQLRRN